MNESKSVNALTNNQRQDNNLAFATATAARTATAKLDPIRYHVSPLSRTRLVALQHNFTPALWCRTDNSHHLTRCPIPSTKVLKMRLSRPYASD